MSSRLKSKKWRVVIALVLILIIISVAAFGYYEYRLQQGRQLSVSVPRPPLVKGCHEYSKSQGWRTVECLSPEYVRSHYPHPKAHISPLQQGGGSGVVGIQPVGQVITSNPIVAASVTVNMQVLGGGYCDVFALGCVTDSVAGDGGFSIQLNTNTFIGRNGDTYWYQFVHQNFPQDLASLKPLFGVWQNDLTVACKNNPTCSNPQGYECDNCVNVPLQAMTGKFSGLVDVHVEPPSPGNYVGVAPNNLVSTLITSQGDAYAVVVPDFYGLSTRGHWQHVSGTILGAGGGSQANFRSPTWVQTALVASYNKIAIFLQTFTDTTTAESNNLAYTKWPFPTPQLQFYGNSYGWAVEIDTVSYV